MNKFIASLLALIVGPMISAAIFGLIGFAVTGGGAIGLGFAWFFGWALLFGTIIPGIPIQAVLILLHWDKWFVYLPLGFLLGYGFVTYQVYPINDRSLISAIFVGIVCCAHSAIMYACYSILLSKIKKTEQDVTPDA